MKNKSMLISVGITVALAVLATGAAISAQDKYTLKVPNGLAFAEFKGYEGWQTISISHNGELLAVILGNPAMIDARKAGVPGNGKPFPDGAKMAKIHWKAKKNEATPGQPLGGTASLSMTPRPIRSGPAQGRTRRRRGTTPSAGSRATR